MSDSIQVTCQACNKSIRAPRAAGGKWGKCPNCKNRVYVPTPDDELEEIPLAPLDDVPAALESEAQDIAAALLREKETDAPPRGSKPVPAARRPAPATSGVEIPDLIIQYLDAMKNSRLADAERIVARLATNAAQAQSRVQQMMVDAMPPPSLTDIPPPLYIAFLKKLQQQLN